MPQFTDWLSDRWRTIPCLPGTFVLIRPNVNQLRFRIRFSKAYFKLANKNLYRYPEILHTKQNKHCWFHILSFNMIMPPWSARLTTLLECFYPLFRGGSWICRISCLLKWLFLNLNICKTRKGCCIVSYKWMCSITIKTKMKAACQSCPTLLHQCSEVYTLTIFIALPIINAPDYFQMLS